MFALACSMRIFFVGFLLLVLLAPPTGFTQPATFDQAKRLARQAVYHDRNVIGDLYCGCSWDWVGRSGGRTDLAGCGYQVRAQPTRAERIEWEHIVPASTFGRQRQCWQHGGRRHCVATDPVFSAMEADMHNLTPVVGEINADRSNFNLGMVATPPGRYGHCPFKVDFASRVAEPPDSAKGLLARVHFYMADRYGLRLSPQQQRILLAWDRQFPVSDWEIERDRRIAAHMGHANPFVAGNRKWAMGRQTAPDHPPPAATLLQSDTGSPPAPFLIVGNRNSRIYHIQGRCPDFDRVSSPNRVPFNNEHDAEIAGFRKAGNCR